MNKFIAVITLFFALASNTYAQQSDKHRLQAQVGLSGVGVLVNVVDQLDVAQAVEVDVSPALHLAYDYFYTTKISLGVAIAYQNIGISYQNYTYEDNGEQITNDYGTELMRVNASVRGLYWYTPDSKVKLYSGLRLGFSNWSVDTNVPDPTYDPDRFINIALGANFAPQLILLGSDIRLGKQWNISGELALGAPYFVAGGIAYRW